MAESDKHKFRREWQMASLPGFFSGGGGRITTVLAAVFPFNSTLRTALILPLDLEDSRLITMTSHREAIYNGSARTKPANGPGKRRPAWVYTLKNHIVAFTGELFGTFLFLFFAFVGTSIANTPSPSDP
jgi:hypothetical protein